MPFLYSFQGNQFQFKMAENREKSCPTPNRSQRQKLKKKLGSGSSSAPPPSVKFSYYSILLWCFWKVFTSNHKLPYINDL